MRARIEVEKIAGKGEREQIVVTEIPYQVEQGAAPRQDRRAACARRRIEGISEVRDESDRDGMRLVIELKKDVFPQVVLNQLYRLTDLQTTFGVINLVDRRAAAPRCSTSRRRSRVFVEHRRDVVTRRTPLRAPSGRGRSARSSKASAWRPPRSTSSIKTIRAVARHRDGARPTS